MSSNILCHGLVLKTQSVVETQIKASFCRKNETSRWTVTRNEKTFAIYIKVYTHQRILRRVFRCRQIVCVMVSF